MTDNTKTPDDKDIDVTKGKPTVIPHTLLGKLMKRAGMNDHGLIDLIGMAKMKGNNPYVEMLSNLYGIHTRHQVVSMKPYIPEPKLGKNSPLRTKPSKKKNGQLVFHFETIPRPKGKYWPAGANKNVNHLPKSQRTKGQAHPAQPTGD